MIKDWIENHKVKWILILFVIGVALGFLQAGLLGASLNQIIKMSFLYGLILPTVEVFAGGYRIK